MPQPYSGDFSLMIGKTVQHVVLKRPGNGRGQALVLFSDGTFLELFAESDIRAANALDKGRLPDAIAHGRLPPYEVFQGSGRINDYDAGYADGREAARDEIELEGIPEETGDDDGELPVDAAASARGQLAIPENAVARPPVGTPRYNTLSKDELFWIAFGVSTLLVIAHAGVASGWYFTFLRWCVFGASVLFGLLVKEARPLLALALGATALCFNPIFPVHLYSREAWVLPDTAAGLFLWAAWLLELRKDA